MTTISGAYLFTMEASSSEVFDAIVRPSEADGMGTLLRFAELLRAETFGAYSPPTMTGTLITSFSGTGDVFPSGGAGSTSYHIDMT